MNTISVQSRPVVLAVEENEVQRTSKRNKNNNCGYSSKSVYQPACSKGYVQQQGYVQQGYTQGVAAPVSSSSSSQGQVVPTFPAQEVPVKGGFEQGYPVQGNKFGQIKG
jgi:hypothetical protein